MAVKKMRWTLLELCAIDFLFWHLYYKIYRRSSDSMELSYTGIE
jgi:hypothetical protein